MSLEIMTAAVNIQDTMLRATDAVGRRRDMLLYAASMVQATVACVEAVPGEESGQAVRETFLAWQRATLARLEEEIATGQVRNDPAYVGLTEAFAAEFRGALAAVPAR